MLPPRWGGGLRHVPPSSPRLCLLEVRSASPSRSVRSGAESLGCPLFWPAAPSPLLPPRGHLLRVVPVVARALGRGESASLWPRGSLPDPPPALPPRPSSSSSAFDPSRLEQLQLEARKGSVVNVNPTNTRPHSDTPEIRKYKKRFNSEILCAALWGERGPGGAAEGSAWQEGLGAADPPSLPPSPHLGACRGELAGGHRERADAPGPQWAGQGLQPHQPPPLPADGRPGGPQPADHHLR